MGLAAPRHTPTRARLVRMRWLEAAPFNRQGFLLVEYKGMWYEFVSAGQHACPSTHRRGADRKSVNSRLDPGVILAFLFNREN